MDENDIEMKDLLGHPRDKDMSSAEEGIHSMEYTANSEDSSQRSMGRSRISRCHLFVIFISLFSTIFFGINIYLYVQKSDSILEPEKKESKSDRDEELENLANCKPVTMAETQKDCFNDPCFHFDLDPIKDCDWVANNPTERCDKQYTVDTFVRDHCPESCGACDSSDNSVTDSSTTLDYGMTIVNGVDDKDTYCEDLSQYDEWHNTKVSKEDGVMYKVVRQMGHDPAAFT